MEEHHRRAIQNNFISLVEQSDLEELVAALYEKGVFSEAMIEPYKDTSKDLRTRKRLLFRHIERRGPNAFMSLLDALRETGKWDLVRLLDPHTVLHPHEQTVSLKKSKVKPNPESTSSAHPPVSTIPSDANSITHNSEVKPKINVIKSTKFHEDQNANISSFVTRSRKRGIALVITNIEFENNIEEYRKGAEVDLMNIKELFDQIGFHQILSYNDLPYSEMKETIANFSQLKDLEYTECVFVIIASHGYARLDTGDTDICCADGIFMPSQFIVEQFNHDNCPKLKNKPKVFIFQACRGTSRETHRQRAQTDSASVPQERLYSDIIIANSTIPGFVSYRDPKEGSWYIQALCAVFAEHAHDTHIDDLFSMVDERLHKHFKVQTSSVERRGFYKRLYLHPGLFEDAVQT